MTSGTLTPVHTYQDNGTYTATLTAKDPSGNVIQDTAKVTVKNVAPTPNAAGAVRKHQRGTDRVQGHGDRSQFGRHSVGVHLHLGLW